MTTFLSPDFQQAILMSQAFAFLFGIAVGIAIGYVAARFGWREVRGRGRVLR